MFILLSPQLKRKGLFLEEGKEIEGVVRILKEFLSCEEN